MGGSATCRLGSSARLSHADWLDGAFSAADVLMVQALRRQEGTRLVEEDPKLAAFVASARTRLAYRGAFVAECAVSTASGPGG